MFLPSVSFPFWYARECTRTHRANTHGASHDMEFVSEQVARLKKCYVYLHRMSVRNGERLARPGEPTRVVMYAKITLCQGHAFTHAIIENYRFFVFSKASLMD